ncbi:MAG TPA: hypothetical protein VGD26_13740 [Chitinophagaceae bacterium]
MEIEEDEAENSDDEPFSVQGITEEEKADGYGDVLKKLEDVGLKDLVDVLGEDPLSSLQFPKVLDNFANKKGNFLFFFACSIYLFLISN